jgi:hypothetical protein
MKFVLQGDMGQMFGDNSQQVTIPKDVSISSY